MHTRMARASGFGRRKANLGSPENCGEEADYHGDSVRRLVDHRGSRSSAGVHGIPNCDSPELSTSTPSSELPFGVAAAYWLDLRSYHPAAVLHGGRDYQVTTAEDLAGCKAGLARRSDVTIRVYDNDNHMFYTGTGPSTPGDYEPAQHIDPAVIADIATWLTSP